MKPKQKPFLQNLDLVTTILPFGCIALLCCLFMLFPEGSANICTRSETTHAVKMCGS